MAGKSDYLENAILNAVLRAVSYTSPATVYIGLYTAAPTDAGGGTEVSGNAYARVAVTFSAAASGATSNSATVSFPRATGGNWGTVSHWGIFDALTNGNLLYWGALGASKTINSGDQAVIAIGELDITED